MCPTVSIFRATIISIRFFGIYFLEAEATVLYCLFKEYESEMFWQIEEKVVIILAKNLLALGVLF